LDCRRPIKKTFFVLCLRRPFDTDRLAVMGQIEIFVGGFFCDGSLAELRRVYSAGAAYSEQGGNIYGGRIQQSNTPLSRTIQKENKVLQQVRRNDTTLPKPTHEKTKPENYHRLTMPKSRGSLLNCTFYLTGITRTTAKSGTTGKTRTGY
jgi:glycosyltransferase A (GT-A) superfamily protein (DUF2064 family)